MVIVSSKNGSNAQSILSNGLFIFSTSYHIFTRFMNSALLNLKSKGVSSFAVTPMRISSSTIYITVTNSISEFVSLNGLEIH